MKRVFFLIMAVLMVLPALAYGQGTNINSRPTADWWTGNGRDVAWSWAKAIDRQIANSNQVGTGSIFYVDADVTNEGDGSSWSNAHDTIEECIALCTANNGDIIYVAPGSSYALSGADAVDLDVAGVRVIGIGNGADMPKFTYATTTGELVFGAASVWLENFRFVAGVSSVTHAIDVEAAADDCAIVACVFTEPTTSSWEFARAITLASGADRTLIAYNTAYSADAVGATNWLDMDAGVNNGTMIVGNYVYGEFAEGAIHSDQVDLETMLAGNYVTNLTAGQHAIEFSAAATGVWSDNRLYSNAFATMYDPGSLKDGGNNWGVSLIDNRALQIPGNNEAVNKTVSKLATGTDDDLFDVDGGPIVIKAFWGLVTTSIGATTTTCEIVFDADSGWTDYDFSTDVTITSDAAGTRYTFTNVAEGVLTPMEGADGGASNLMSGGGWLCGEGMIEQNMSTTDNDGAITWYMTYFTLDEDTVVTAQ